MRRANLAKYLDGFLLMSVLVFFIEKDFLGLTQFLHDGKTFMNAGTIKKTATHSEAEPIAAHIPKCLIGNNSEAISEPKPNTVVKEVKKLGVISFR